MAIPAALGRTPSSMEIDPITRPQISTCSDENLYFLGALRIQAVEKLRKLSGIAAHRVKLKIENWSLELLELYLSHVDTYVSRADPGVPSFEIDHGAHLWKDSRDDRAGTATKCWTYPTISAVEKVFDLLQITDCRFLRLNKDKGGIAGFKNLLRLDTGDFVIAGPPMTIKHRTSKMGDKAKRVTVEILFSQFFVPNADGSIIKISCHQRDVSFAGANKDLWPVLARMNNYNNAIKWGTGRNLLEMHAYYSQALDRFDMVSNHVLSAAARWAQIPLQDIGTSNHPFRMNPRLTVAMCGRIVPDAIREEREQKKNHKAQMAQASVEARKIANREKARLWRQHAKAKAAAAQAAAAKKHPLQYALNEYMQAKRRAAWLAENAAKRLKA